MSKVVYISRGLLSYVNASLGLCSGLAQEGYEVTYLCPDKSIATLVMKQGFQFVHLNVDEQLAKRSASLGSVPKGNPLAAMKWLQAKLKIRRASLTNGEVERALEAEQADLVIVDVECHVAIMAAVQAGFPVILTSILFNLYRTGRLPPLNSKLVPPKSMVAQLRVSFAWSRLRIQTVMLRLGHRASPRGIIDLIRPVRYQTVDYYSLRAVARARKFPLNRHTSRGHFLRPFVYTRLPLAYMCPKELEFPHSAKDRTTYLGCTVHLKRADVREHRVEAQRWEAFHAGRSFANPARPLIYCSLGTYLSTNTAFLRRVIEVFCRRSDWGLVLGLGGKSDTSALGQVPGNVLALVWAPQLDILTIADAAITHCGTSTILECVSTGTPIIAYSSGFLDQDGNAARVGFHGIGVVGDFNQDGPADIEEKISRALASAAIRSNIQNMREQWSMQAPHKEMIAFARRHYPQMKLNKPT